MIRKYLILTAIASALTWNCPEAEASEQSSYMQTKAACVQGGECPRDSISAGPGPDDSILPPYGMVEKTLPNGLGYVIMRNGSPSKMIECRLIFRTGSVMETDGNRGAAHFLEHMAFGGTRHFPKRKLVEYLESLGVQYGIGINAFTGYDRTIYMFSIPSDNPENLDNALLILKDWLTDITLEPRKVEGEKGIILEELRNYDVGDPFYSLKIGTGRYGEGIPLGTEEEISRITPEILKDFHARWYTLDRATVAIVGDMDTEDAEKRIKRVLGPLKPTASPDFREVPLEYAAGFTVKGIRDPMARKMEAEFIIPHKAVMRKTLGDAILAGREKMLTDAISLRLHGTGRRASVSNDWYFADKEHFVISASGKDKEETGARLHDAIAEIHRIAKDGFRDGELDEVKASLRQGGRTSFSSSFICDNIADAVLFGDREVTDSMQTRYVMDALRATTSGDLREILREWLDAAGQSTLVAFSFNPAETDGFSAAEAENLWKDAASAELGPYVFVKEDGVPEDTVKTAVPDFLLAERPCRKELVVEREHYPDINVTDVLLTNGFRLVLRPTEDEESKIYMQIFAPGGLSRIPEENYARYKDMAGYMELGGIEGVEDSVYHSVMAENGIGMLLAMESYWHGILASAPSSSLRLMLNLVYGKMMHPGLNRDDFEEIRQGEIESWGEESYLSSLMKHDVQRLVNMQIDSLMGNLMRGRRTETTLEDLMNLDLDSLASAYKRLYANPSGMTCVICGDFDTDSLLTEAVPVFGQIPAGKEPNRMGPSHFSLPQTTFKSEFPNDNDSQTVFDYIRFGTFEPSLRSGLKLKLMNNLIRNRLITVLREQESLVYSPYISLFYNALPDSIFYMDINASVDTKNTARVHEILDGIIGELRKKKVSEKELNTLKRIFIVNRRTYLEEDATSNWKTHLVTQLKNEESLADFNDYENILESITPREIRDEFRRCFGTDRHIIISTGPFNTDRL